MYWGGDLPSGPMVKNSPVNAGDTGSIPDPGRFLVAYRATKPECHEYWARAHSAQALQQEKAPQWEAQALQLEGSPRLPQLEKACVRQWRPSATKIIKIK